MLLKKQKLFGEKLKEDLELLDEFITRNHYKKLCAVFDVGTKGVRVIVGPRIPLNEFRNWNPDKENIFYTASLDAQLGADFERDYGELDVENKSLSQTIKFLKEIRKRLFFLSKSDIKIVGTAIFRWLGNQKAILNILERETGLPRLETLTSKQEAYYSLLAITFTNDKISGQGIIRRNFEDTDVIVLFDQGGGSTEISYFFPNDPNKTELRSMFHVGSVALEKKFMQKYKSENFYGRGQKITIEESLNRVEEYINGLVDGLQGFSEIIPKANSLPEYNIIAFGMGSALKICFEQFFGNLLKRKISGKKFRGWSLKIGQINKTYETVKNEIQRKYITVENLLNDKGKPNSLPIEDIDSKLQMLYALKTYETLMRKFKTPLISYSYYNLKYGIYLQHFVEGVSQLFSPPVKESLYKNFTETTSAKQRIDILESIEAGTDEAYSFHDFMLDTFCYILGGRITNPKKETKVDGGAKRVDISLENANRPGFLSILSDLHKIKCPKIFIECKNNSNLTNRDFDQIAGRLDETITQFGVLICRMNLDPEKVNLRCKLNYLRKKTLIMILDDRDINKLLTFKEYNQESKIDSFFLTRLDEIIMEA